MARHDGASDRRAPLGARSRELRWAAITLGQVLLLLALPGIENLLSHLAWFQDISDVLGETTLAAFWLAVTLVIPMSVAVLVVLILDVVRSYRGRRVWVTAIEHVLAAALGALAFSAGLARSVPGGSEGWMGALATAYLVFNVVLVAIYWPRLAFRSLRAPAPADPR